MRREVNAHADRTAFVREAPRFLYEAGCRLELFHLRAARILGLAQLPPPPARVAWSPSMRSMVAAIGRPCFAATINRKRPSVISSGPTGVR
ncbi:MAG: hypothetical protein ACREMD_00280 [Gemmatimonadota bacterium]